MMRRLFYPTLALLLLGALAWALWPRPIAVDLALIGRQTIEAQITEEGKAQIREVFTVSAPIAGRMARLSLHAGDQVIAGETKVAEIHPAAPALLDARTRGVAEAALKAADAGVELAEAEVTKAAAELAFRRSEAERAEALRARDVISTRALDVAKLDLAAAEAALVSAKANLAVRGRERDSAQAALIEDDALATGGTPAPAGDCCLVLRAPASGQVLRVLTESEQVVQPGQPLLEIGDPAAMEVEADLLSEEAVGLKPGTPALIEGWGGPALRARLERIEPAAVTRISALGIEEQRVSALLQLEEPPEAWAGLGDGFRVRVRLTQARAEGVLAVPQGALFRQGAGWAVFVDAGGRAARRAVTLGLEGGGFAEVVEGLAEGEAVILHPSDQIEDGTPIAPRAP